MAELLRSPVWQSSDYRSVRADPEKQGRRVPSATRSYDMIPRLLQCCTQAPLLRTPGVSRRQLVLHYTGNNDCEWWYYYIVRGVAASIKLQVRLPCEYWNILLLGVELMTVTPEY